MQSGLTLVTPPDGRVARRNELKIDDSKARPPTPAPGLPALARTTPSRAPTPRCRPPGRVRRN